MRAFLRSVSVALAVAWLPAIAGADGFTLVEQFRSYYVSANPAAVGADGRVTDSDVPLFAQDEAPGPFEIEPIRQRLVVVSPDGTATAIGDVSLSHQSVIDSRLISFESAVSASAEVTLTDPRAQGFVGATSNAWVDAIFDVLQPMDVTLSMHSAVQGPNASFAFDLRRGDVIVWGDESAVDPLTGMPTNDFTRLLTLQSGRYRLSAGLRSDAGPGQAPSLGTAGFTLAPATAVPEPQAWLLMLAGLIGLGLFKGRLRPAEA